MGHRCKTLLPVAGSLLQPSFPTEADTRKLLGTKQRQQHYYNKQVRPLEPISIGDTVRRRLPGEKRGVWEHAQLKQTHGAIGYKKEMLYIYRRNRRQLIKKGESSEPTLPEDIFTPLITQKFRTPEQCL